MLSLGSIGHGYGLIINYVLKFLSLQNGMTQPYGSSATIVLSRWKKVETSSNSSHAVKPEI
jgi:hypothetical protein